MSRSQHMLCKGCLNCFGKYVNRKLVNKEREKAKESLIQAMCLHFFFGAHAWDMTCHNLVTQIECTTRMYIIFVRTSRALIFRVYSLFLCLVGLFRVLYFWTRKLEVVSSSSSQTTNQALIDKFCPLSINKGP